MKWLFVLGICWFLITHGPAALSWYFSLGFFPIPLIFWDFFPQSWCWTLCVTLSLAWNASELFLFFPVLTPSFSPFGCILQVQITKYFAKEIKNHKSCFPATFRYSGKPRRGALVERALSGASSSHMEITRVAWWRSWVAYNFFGLNLLELLGLNGVVHVWGRIRKIPDLWWRLAGSYSGMVNFWSVALTAATIICVFG